MSLSTPVMAGTTGLASFAVSEVALDQGDSLLDLAKPILDAVMHGQGFLAAALALVFLVAVARRYGGERIPFLQTDAGGALLALVGSFGGAVATALAAGSAVTGALLYTALGVAFAAAGGYAVLRKLAAPILETLAAKVPILKPVVDLLLWVLNRKETVVKKAEAAGDAAVKANPAPGLDGVVGAGKDFE